MKRKTVQHWVILIVLVYIVFEGLSFVCLRVLESWKGISYESKHLALSHQERLNLDAILRNPYVPHTPHPVMGWTLKSNWQSKDRTSWTNAMGIRAQREYAESAPEGILRIAAFGDSFMYGSEVGNTDAWSHRFEEDVPNTEVLNFGVPGYGLDQAYLRYKEEGRSYHPDIVIIGFFLENMRRSVNTFRPFLTRSAEPLAKPRFLLKEDALVLAPAPLKTYEDYSVLRDNECEILRTLMEHDRFAPNAQCPRFWQGLPSVRLMGVVRDQWGRANRKRPPRKKGYLHAAYYKEDSEAFRVTTAVFDMFVADVLADGAVPLIVLFPARPDLDWETEYDGELPHATLLNTLDDRGYSYVDFMYAFPNYRTGETYREFFAREKWGHYSPRGNAVVAEELERHLREEGLL